MCEVLCCVLAERISATAVCEALAVVGVCMSSVVALP